MQPTLFAPAIITAKIFPPPPYEEQALQRRLEDYFNRFTPADKADVIAQLWATPPEPGGALKGLALCDRMAQDGEYTRYSTIWRTRPIKFFSPSPRARCRCRTRR